MKKLLIMLIAGMFVLALVAPTMADVTISGVYRVRMWYLDVQDVVPQTDLTVDANADGIPDNTPSVYETGDVTKIDHRARISLKANIVEGLSFNSRFDLNEGDWGTSRSDIGVDYAYMTFALPATPFTAQLGRQDVSWYNGVAANLDTRDRLKLTGKFDGVVAGIAYDKTTERYSDDDANIYVGFAKFPAGPVGLGVLGLLSKDETVDQDIYIIDLAGKGSAGAINYGFEGAYKTGSKGAVDYSSYGIFANLDTVVGPANLGVALAYASGDDPDTADNEGFAFDRDSDFQALLLFSDTFDIASSGDSGFGNGIGVKVSAGFSPAANLKANVAAFYAKALEPDEAYGSEIDVTLSYAIYEALTFSAGLGYLMPGDMFGSDPDNAFAATGKFQVTF